MLLWGLLSLLSGFLLGCWLALREVEQKIYHPNWDSFARKRGLRVMRVTLGAVGANLASQPPSLQEKMAALGMRWRPHCPLCLESPAFASKNPVFSQCSLLEATLWVPKSVTTTH